ncbi:MAG TPA: peptidoglycan-binding protein [Limnochordales bacterium]
MPWRGLRRPLGRLLRPGSRGERVAALQRRLKELGYDPGAEDGIYGHQTAEAVRDLQRDLGLRVDGIAGPRVMAVLADPDLLDMRRSHTAAPGETLADAARALGVAPQVLRRACGLARRGSPAPGQRLVVWERWVAAEVKPGAGQGGALRTLGRRAALVSAAAVVARGAPADDPAAGEAAAAVAALGLPVWVTLHTRREPALVPGDEEPGRLQRLLHRAREREDLVTRAQAWCGVAPVAGVHVDLSGLRFGDGPRALGLVGRLADELRSAGRQLIVSVPLRDLSGVWGRVANDLDWEALGRLAARVVLVPPLLVDGPEPRPPSPAELRRRLRPITRRVSPWRCLVALPVGALVVPQASPEPGPHASLETPQGQGEPAPGLAVVSYPRAAGLARAARTRPQWEEAAGRPVFRCPVDGRESAVWLENRTSLAVKLELVEALRLGGVYLSAVGEEDGRLWGLLEERWKVHKPAPVAPSESPPDGPRAR